MADRAVSARCLLIVGEVAGGGGQAVGIVRMRATAAGYSPYQAQRAGR